MPLYRTNPWNCSNVTIGQIPLPYAPSEYTGFAKFFKRCTGEPLDPSTLLTEDVEAHFIAYIDEDNPIGSVQVNRDTEGRLHIHRLFVHPDYRKQSVGRRLLQVALEAALMFNEPVYAWTEGEEHEGATVLLADYGFEECDEAPPEKE